MPEPIRTSVRRAEPGAPVLPRRRRGSSERGPEPSSASRAGAAAPTPVRNVLVFLLLTYALTWWVVPLGSDDFPVFPYGPDAALVVLIVVTTGGAGLRRLGRSLRRWRAPAGWYALAVLAPPAIALAAVVATRTAGAPPSALPGPSSAVEFLLLLPVMVLIGGALGEELGWRGYALPLLQRRWSPLTAVAAIFGAHAIWHLPLFFTADPPAPAPFLVELAAGGIVLAWLMNSTRVIWLPILMHGAHNMGQQAFMSDVTGSDLVRLQWFTAAGWAALAAVVLIVSRGRLVPRGSGPLLTALHESTGAPESGEAR